MLHLLLPLSAVSVGGVIAEKLTMKMGKKDTPFIDIFIPIALMSVVIKSVCSVIIEMKNL